MMQLTNDIYRETYLFLITESKDKNIYHKFVRKKNDIN